MLSFCFGVAVGAVLVALIAADIMWANDRMWIRDNNRWRALAEGRCVRCGREADLHILEGDCDECRRRT